MTLRTRTIVGLTLITVLLGFNTPAALATDMSLADYVNPLVGTDSEFNFSNGKHLSGYRPALGHELLVTRDQ